MKLKRGQVTLFVIIAVAVVVIALIAFLVYQKNKTGSEKNIADVKAQVDDILETLVLNDIIAVTYKGGYAITPDDSFPTPHYPVAYWVEGNETFYPSIEEIRYNIDFLNSFIGNLNLSQAFPDYEITIGDLKSNTTILPEKVVVLINWPITIKKGSTTQTIKDFDYSYDIRLKKVYESATYTADSIAKGNLPDKMPPEINLTIYNYNKTSLYELKDTNQEFKINDQYFTLVFAAK